jgi:hypothetical protein
MAQTTRRQTGRYPAPDGTHEVAYVSVLNGESCDHLHDERESAQACYQRRARAEQDAVDRAYDQSAAKREDICTDCGGSAGTHDMSAHDALDAQAADILARLEVPTCDYCDSAAVVCAMRSVDDEDDRLCRVHARNVRPDEIIARWTGTYWQAVR